MRINLSRGNAEEIYEDKFIMGERVVAHPTKEQHRGHVFPFSCFHTELAHNKCLEML